MVRIHYGDLSADNYISSPNIYFNNQYEDKWMVDPLTVEMVRDVDESEVIDPGVIDSPFLGAIAPESLSGGVKTLILINNDPSHIFNASACGDNCAKWILKIGEKKDILIRLGHFMEFGEGPFEIEVENVGKIAHDKRELIDAIFDDNLFWRGK